MCAAGDQGEADDKGGAGQRQAGRAGRAQHGTHRQTTPWTRRRGQAEVRAGRKPVQLPGLVRKCQRALSTGGHARICIVLYGCLPEAYCTDRCGKKRGHGGDAMRLG